MAQPRDPVTGRFMSAAAPTGAGDAAIETMKKFSESLKGFTKNVGEKIAPAAKSIGAAGLRGARGAGTIINERRKEAGFTQAAMNDKLLGDHPILHAIAGGGMDLMNMMGRGLKGLVKGKSGETGDALGGGKGGETTEDKLEERAILEKISDNVEKIAESDGGGDGKAAPEPAKKGGILGMLAGVGGMMGGMMGGLFNIKTIKTVFTAIGSVFTKLAGMAKAIPGMVSKMMPWLKQGAKFFKQIFKRLFWPVTALIGVFSFIDGFIAGYEEGGLIEGFKQGIESLFKNLVDVPLNMFKSAVAWIMGKLGFENIEKALNSFDFDIGGMLADGFQILIDFFQDIPDILTDFVIWLAGGLGDWAGGKVLSGLGIDVEEHEKNKAAKEAARAERDKKTEERRSGVEDLTVEERHDRGELHHYPGAGSERSGEALGGGDVAVSDRPESWKDGRRSYAQRQRARMRDQARQIKAAGGKTGKFRHGKLVEVDGKPYTAPTPTGSPDARAGAASTMQDSALGASGGQGSNVNLTTVNQTTNEGGRSTFTMPPPSMETDPSLLRPAF